MILLWETPRVSGNPDEPDMIAMVCAVTTRAQAREKVKHKPYRLPDTPKHTGVDRVELIRLQQDGETIVRISEGDMSEKIVREEHNSSRKEIRPVEGLTYDEPFLQKAGGSTCCQ